MKKWILIGFCGDLMISGQLYLMEGCRRKLKPNFAEWQTGAAYSLRATINLMHKVNKLHTAVQTPMLFKMYLAYA